jgi:hypothetical protein
MKKSVICYLLFVICSVSAVAAEDKTPVIVRPAIFSTSSDWEAVTGLRLSQYRIKFTPDAKLIQNGLELYYLDSFPCYGQPDRTMVWLDKNGHSERDMMLACLYTPETIKFAWRNAAYDTTQRATTGIIDCPVFGENNMTIDLSKCTVGQEWNEIK